MVECDAYGFALILKNKNVVHEVQLSEFVPSPWLDDWGWLLKASTSCEFLNSGAKLRELLFWWISICTVRNDLTAVIYIRDNDCCPVNGQVFGAKQGRAKRS